VTIWNKQVEMLPRDELRTLQESRLRSQVSYVYSRSAFYQRKFAQAGIGPEDIRTLEDLKRLPLTTKDELRASQDESHPYGEHVSAHPRDIVWLPSTSGTTGVPLLLPRTARDIETWTELNARAFTATGIGREDVYQNILGYHWIFGGLALHAGAQRVGAAVVNAGMGNTVKQLWAMNYLGTTAFHATPSYLMHLGAQIASADVPQTFKLRTIIAGGEVGMASSAAKARLRELFPDVQTFADVGGVTDVGTMIWAECTHMNGGHLAEDSVLCEILDPVSGDAVPEGEVGELVLTDLVSEGAPLLRYRVGDLTRIDTAPCPCGRTLARLPDGILGRADDMFTVRSANVYPSAIDAVIKSASALHITEYQVMIDRPDNLDVLTIRIEIAEDLNRSAVEEGISELNDRLKLAIGSRAEIEIVPTDTLPSFVYKAMRIIDKRKGQSEMQAFEKADQQRGI